MSQNSDILNHLKTVGPLTALDALDLFGCFRLASRINDLRQAGNDIETADITLPNGKTIAQYSLKVRHGQG
jgi:hypothetical protein